MLLCFPSFWLAGLRSIKQLLVPLPPPLALALLPQPQRKPACWSLLLSLGSALTLWGAMMPLAPAPPALALCRTSVGTLACLCSLLRTRT